MYVLPFLSCLCCVAFAVNITTLSPQQSMQQKRHEDLIKETVPVGMMFASKAFVQLLANPIVGPLTHRQVRMRKESLSRRPR